ncbi:MAG: IS30 family transposase, partial [Actinomycetota bacterium]|nr:IS30 family transposase [Actinomycetota bacterium]
VLRRLGGVIRPYMLAGPMDHRLSLEDRVDIFVGLRAGLSFSAIGEQIGFSVSTVSREVGGGDRRDSYRPVSAHLDAERRRQRPKPTKLASNPVLCAKVIEGLEAWASPEQISNRLRLEHPDDEAMRVSHETIYQSIYVQGRGELRRELAACLRSGRAQRQQHNRLERRGRIPDMVSISERPAEIEDRAVPGHWEGDLIIGAGGRSAIGTLVERTTRFVILLHLPERHGAIEVRDAMIAAIQQLPEMLRGSITWDQGTEMSAHAQFTVATGVDVYFCDPHSPWQRGTNENTNGLLRQYFPKGIDLSRFDTYALQAAADSLNNRPRKTLGWATPAEALAATLAPTV